MSRLLRLGAFHPVGVLLAVAAASALALFGLVDLRTGRLRLEIDPSVDRLLPRNDEERRFYERIRHVFGDDETLLVALATDDLFTPARLRSVERVSHRLEELPGVKRVLSLATAPLLRSDVEGVVVESLADVASPADADRLRVDLRRSPLHRGVLVSNDERVAAFLVTLDVGDRDFLEGGYRSRIEAIGKEEAPGAAIWVTGPLVVKADTARGLLRSLAVVLPATLALGALVLWLAFRNAAGVLLPLGTIGIGLLWTLGTLAWLDRPLNLVTAIAPPLVVTLGLAYAMHVVSEWARTAPADPHTRAAEADRVVRAMQGVALPALIAALTTAAGLAALVLSPLAAIREFGWVALLGLGYVTLLCFTLIPAGLRLFARSSSAGPLPGAGLVEAGWEPAT
jgi:predicted RND superfamily exporter protein